MRKKFLMMMVILISLGLLAGCGNTGNIGMEPEDGQPGEVNNGAFDAEENSQEVVLENMAFKIYEPVPHAEVQDIIVVRGLARVFEATVQYEFEDGHFIFDKGFTTATEGAPGWGEFEIIIELEEKINGSCRVILFEESAKDGSRMHELQIPVTVKE